MKSHLTRDFRLFFSRLPERIQRVARQNYRLWRRNPNHPGLAFKRVGKKTNAFSIRVGLGWRALAVRHGDVVIWFWIGSHAEYEKRIKKL